GQVFGLGRPILSRAGNERRLEPLLGCGFEIIVVRGDEHDVLWRKTAFVARPTEYGPAQTKDLTAAAPWDIVTDTFGGVADALGCPR
ncbi:MAG: hypothetical protein AAFU50_04465, partial [Pseudomonadota bacterium]